jgi:hypothetical protein
MTTSATQIDSVFDRFSALDKDCLPGVFPIKMNRIMQAGTARSAVNLRAMILDTLRQGPFHPAELFEKLQSPQITEDRLKDELAALIEAHLVELSPDRNIRLYQRQPAAAT